MNAYNEYDNHGFSRIDVRYLLEPKIIENTTIHKITNYKDKFGHLRLRILLGGCAEG